MFNKNHTITNEELQMSTIDRKIASVLVGVAVGDALGVPVEFMSRSMLQRRPITDMTGYGTNNQPAGTFSDDTSLTLCLVESLCGEYSVNDIADKFLQWAEDGYWTAHGDVFDIGIATQEALDRISEGVDPTQAGGTSEYSNGNGSLMRIAPLVFHVASLSAQERWTKVREVSSITHGHIRSIISCYYYIEFLRELLQGHEPQVAYSNLQSSVPTLLNRMDVPLQEQANLDRLLNGNLYELPESEIKSSGYVIHALEASIWCLMTTDNFESSVLKAVNLGDDTDTTAAITGALAGLNYGIESIPESWLSALARKDDILALAGRLAMSIQGGNS